MAAAETGALVLTPVEKRLAGCVRAGEELDLSAGEGVSETAMDRRDRARTIRAVVIRDLLRGLLVPDADPRGVQLRGAAITGLLDLRFVTCGVPLVLSGCDLPDGLDGSYASLPALSLRRSRIERGVRLVGAHIGGPVDAEGATLMNESGPALIADGVRVDQQLFLAGLTADGVSESGTIRLWGSRVGGTLNAVGARVVNAAGPALNADTLQVGQDLFLQDLTATGVGQDGALRLAGARIGGELDASGARLTNDTGPALVGETLQVGQELYLWQGFSATGFGDGVVNLRGAQTGRLALDPAGIKDPSGRPGGLTVDGLVYSGLPASPSVRDWLDVLARRTPRYTAQPYQQLAAATRAAGHDGDTRRILIAQRQDQLDHQAVTARFDRAWAKFTGLTLGYGYQPWRALVLLLCVAAASVVLTLIAGTYGGLAHTSARSFTAGSSCTAIERIGVGLDLSLPLIKTGARETCATTPSALGDVITIGGWILQLAAWALATLFIAGFTSAVRKT